MALVHMEHVRLDVGRKNGSERAQAADTENHLLTDACVLVSTVQVAGNPTVVLAVIGQVRVQQVQRHAAYLSHPDTRENVAARERYFDHHRSAMRVLHWSYRDSVRIQTVVCLVLVARR